MKCTVIIDPTREEEVVIYARERNGSVEEICALVEGTAPLLVGYGDGTVVRLQPDDIHAVITEEGRVFALTHKEKLRLEHRLYTLEEKLGQTFVKINQSCLGNVGKIKRFDVSIGGALMVTFQNGYTDYVSRRQLKSVKERIGFKR